MDERIALIGFGEAGAGLCAGGARAFDVKTDDPDLRDAKLADYRAHGVTGCETAAQAMADAAVILSLVTADQALAAATSCAPYLVEGAFWIDLNSAAPATKLLAAGTVEAAGGRYVDAAIMSPVYPARRAVPLLLSGREAAAAARELARLGFTNCRIVGARVGQASAIKMIRSVMVKGIEALTAECLLAADAAGVTEEVLASLDASGRAQPWAKAAAYNLDRMIVHGLRRADEMDEAVRTLEDLGVEPALSRATALRQREIGNLRLGSPESGLAAKLSQIAGKKARAA